MTNRLTTGKTAGFSTTFEARTRPHFVKWTAYSASATIAGDT